jgi:L-2-hydroxycarboxylate dehydrogenase (NAD+)
LRLPIRLSSFADEDEFRKQVDHYREVFLGARTADGQKMVFPGDPEDESFARRSEHGVPLVCDVVRDLRDIASQLQITFD